MLFPLDPPVERRPVVSRGAVLGHVRVHPGRSPWSAARTWSTTTPFASMIATEMSIRPCVFETAGEGLSVQRPEDDVLTQSLDAPRYDDRMSTRGTCLRLREHPRGAGRTAADARGDLRRRHDRRARGARRRRRLALPGGGRAGGGSIARWLADRVAPDGAVLGDRPRHHGARRASRIPGLEVRVHDLLDARPARGRVRPRARPRMLLAWLPDPTGGPRGA